MRILLIHQYFLEKDDGGGSRFNEMSVTWASMGHSVTVLAGMVHYATGRKRQRYLGKWTYRDTYAAGVEVIRCHVSEAYNVNFLGRLWAYFAFVLSSVYAGLFKAKGKYDVILATSPPLFVGVTAYLLSVVKRVPFVFEVRDLWPESAIDTGVLRNRILIKIAFWFEKLIYRKALMINVLTPAFKRKLVQSKNVPADKVIFIPNAADFSMSEKVLKTFNRKEFRKQHSFENKMVFTYVGAHGVANHLMQVIDAADKLNGDNDILFVLIGNGMQKPMLMDEVERRKVCNVKFIDQVPKSDVFKYIAASDVGMSILKKVDTFKTIYSNKTFDYMSCKRPVLMVIDGISRELVEEAECGLYAEPENSEDFVRKVREFCDMSPAELDQMGSAGYRFAKTNFDRNILAGKYLEHITEFLK